MMMSALRFSPTCVRQRQVALMSLIAEHVVPGPVGDVGAQHVGAFADHPTIGDIACFPYTAMAGAGGISLGPYPHILSWIDRMKQIPRVIPTPGIPEMSAAA